MGMFDTVHFPCKCGKTAQIQSKAGDCVLANYDCTSVPADIAADIIGAVAYCNCGRGQTIRGNCPEPTMIALYGES